MRNAYCTNGRKKVFQNNLPSSADQNTFWVYSFFKLYSEIRCIALCIYFIYLFYFICHTIITKNVGKEEKKKWRGDLTDTIGAETIGAFIGA